MRKGPETFAELCDMLCSTACYTTAARRLGVSPASVFRWMAASARGEPGYEFEWFGEMLPLHAHVKRAIRVQAAAIEGSARHRALVGHDEPVFYQGRPQWKEDEAIAAYDPDGKLTADELELLFGQRDRWQRDAAGHRVQLSIHRHASDGLVALTLRATFKAYSDRKEIAVSHQGGVLHLHSGPPRPNPVETTPALTAPAVTAVAHEIERHAVEDQEMVEDQAMVSEPREDLDRDALDNPDDGPPEPPRSYTPPPPASIDRDADMRRAREGVGYGEPLAGGFKVS